MMLDEIKMLLSYVDRADADTAEYFFAISEENCLGKRSGKTRALTYKYLADLYSLDYSTVLFRGFIYFWNRDPIGQPLLALLCSYARDAILRSVVPFILRFPEGTSISRASIENYIGIQEPGRFSDATRKSTAQNINSTLTKSGHLAGRSTKVRARANATVGSVSFALLLGYLSGARGPALFFTEYAKLLDCSFDRAVELAEDASRRGWISFKRVGQVVEVLFPNLINAQEMEWLREPN